MATDEELGLPIKGTYPAKVIEVIDEFKVTKPWRIKSYKNK